MSFRQRGEKKSHVFDTTAKQAMWRWRRVATASQSGGKRESEVRVTSGCRRCAENVCCLSSLIPPATQAIQLTALSDKLTIANCDLKSISQTRFIVKLVFTCSHIQINCRPPGFECTFRFISLLRDPLTCLSNEKQPKGELNLNENHSHPNYIELYL